MPLLDIPLDPPELLPLEPPLLDPPLLLWAPLLLPPLVLPDDPPLETPLPEPPFEPPEEPPEPPPFEVPLSSPPPPNELPRSPPAGEELHPYAVADATSAANANNPVFFMCGLWGRSRCLWVHAPNTRSFRAKSRLRYDRHEQCRPRALASARKMHAPERIILTASDASSARVQGSANVQLVELCADSA
jgi:hypothetical protein